MAINRKPEQVNEGGDAYDTTSCIISCLIVLTVLLDFLSDTYHCIINSVQGSIIHDR
jgi:hypothetical protein